MYVRLFTRTLQLFKISGNGCLYRYGSKAITKYVNRWFKLTKTNKIRESQFNTAFLLYDDAQLPSEFDNYQYRIKSKKGQKKVKKRSKKVS